MIFYGICRYVSLWGHCVAYALFLVICNQVLGEKGLIVLSTAYSFDRIRYLQGFRFTREVAGEHASLDGFLLGVRCVTAEIQTLRL